MWFSEAAPIITYSIGVILGSNFRYQSQEINNRILIKCARDDIARKLFWNNVTMKEIKIQNVYIQFGGAWIESPFRVSSSKHRNMLSNVTGCPNMLQKFAHRVFSACWIQICHHICSLTIPVIQAYQQYWWLKSCAISVTSSIFLSLW